jgi:hypothetical protein
MINQLLHYCIVFTKGVSNDMKEDLLPFLAGVGLLVLYLVFSAMTEMGTRWPWKK